MLTEMSKTMTYPCDHATPTRDDEPASSQRRLVLKLATVSAAGGCALQLGTAQADDSGAGMRKGDLLVPAKGDATAPLKVSDIQVGAKPVLAFPFDLSQKKARDESRLNKLLLVKLDEAQMSDEMKAVAIQGVVAFSAICTHQACDVTEWRAQEKLLMCFCHFSKFDPYTAGSVAKGPASRSLPNVPLSQIDGVLTIAGDFSAKPGA